MKFDMDLNANPFSSKYPLIKDEIFMLTNWFKEIRDNADNIPSNLYDIMISIEEQMLKDYRLSSKQIDLVGDTVTKFCR